MKLRLPFHTRMDAGVQLSAELAELKNAEDTYIFALVRGGVVTGAALARELALPLYPYIVRKLGHPDHREYALGAIAEGGATFLDEQAMTLTGTTWADLEPVVEEEMAELKRRRTAYLAAGRPDPGGKTIIVTDDGAATGATLFAAIEDLRNAKAKRIVAALPVCPPDTAARLRERADDVRILAEPAAFHAVGQWYREFPQVEDEEVLRLLAETAKMRA